MRRYEKRKDTKRDAAKCDKATAKCEDKKRSEEQRG